MKEDEFIIDAMQSAHLLHQYKILLVDADQQLSQVTRAMLSGMGFKDILLTTSGRDALAMLAEKNFDFLITEWNTQAIDGIELIRHIRRDADSRDPTLPIIMLSGRSEQSDVLAARDAGINEYVVKPFSARTVYDRLERLIDFPRHFVVAQDFIGPDRRHKSAPPAGVSERRVRKLLPQHTPPQAARDIHSGGGPRLWLPSYALRRKLGEHTTLASLMTPAALNRAQAAIDAITDESMQWIKADLAELKAARDAMMEGDHSPALVHALGVSALSMRGRAGTFGYTGTSEVAYMLYLFCRKQCHPDNAAHRTVLGKYIEVLQVMVGNEIRGAGTTAIAPIIKELRTLTEKFAETE